ncbi:hypothetical protein SLEP1_g51655 [Rubroshorea leprosula]|uniref:Uncharacterized protein n=1 Tax=Rubroshorea leprosula TaxID=152421 RepID=A0AAV5M3Y2_9ROSI|nr:hypothetical protein SLEP1_g51655 [Rubroshorea leprosula]
MDCGPVVDKCDGLKEYDGLVANPSGMVGSSKENRLDDDNVGQLASVREIDRGDLMGQRHRKIKECYSKEPAELWAERGQLVTPRTKLRQGRREMARKVATETVKRVGSMSLSDGCIMHRNQVIQRELNLHEVRKMMRVGKRLGIEMQDNEDAVESRLLELEDRDEERGRNLKRN